MKKGDVVTVICISGEYVGKIKEMDGSTLTLEDPRMLIQNQNQMGFAAGIAVTSKENPTEVKFQQYVFMTETNPEIEKAYRSAVSGLVL